MAGVPLCRALASNPTTVHHPYVFLSFRVGEQCGSVEAQPTNLKTKTGAGWALRGTLSCATRVRSYIFERVNGVAAHLNRQIYKHEFWIRKSLGQLCAV